MTGKLGAAERILQDEIVDVERRLAGLEALRARRDRLVESLKALRRVDDVSVADIRLSAPEGIDGTVRKVFADAQAMRVPVPPSPSPAAMLVLAETHRPMHLREIVEAMQSRGWFTDRSYESLRGTIASTLNENARKGDAEVRKTGPGTYEAIIVE